MSHFTPERALLTLQKVDFEWQVSSGGPAYWFWAKYICLNGKMLLSSWQIDFFQMAKCICPNGNLNLVKSSKVDDGMTGVPWSTTDWSRAEYNSPNAKTYLSK